MRCYQASIFLPNSKTIDLPWMHNHLLYIKSSWTTAIWKHLNPILDFLYLLLWNRTYDFGLNITRLSCFRSISKPTISWSVLIQRLLHLLVRHPTPWDQWCTQSVAWFWYVDDWLHEQWACSIPHVILLVELSITPRAKIHFNLFELIKWMLDFALNIKAIKISLLYSVPPSLSYYMSLFIHLPRHSMMQASQVYGDSSSHRVTMKTSLWMSLLFDIYDKK